MSLAELNPQQILELQTLLEASQDELKAHLQHTDLATRPVTLDQQSVGRVSRIDAIQQQQMARANQDQAATTLQLVEAALRRLESGDFGFYLHCAETIAFARLQAQPFASLCVDCQAASESH